MLNIMSATLNPIVTIVRGIIIMELWACWWIFGLEDWNSGSAGRYLDWIWKVGTLGVLVVCWKNEGMAVAL